MLTTKLAFSATHILQNLQFFDICLLLRLPAPSKAYHFITDSDTTAWWALMINPSNHSTQLPKLHISNQLSVAYTEATQTNPADQTNASDHYDATQPGYGFLSGWAGCIDYSQEFSLNPELRGDFYRFDYCLLLNPENNAVYATSKAPLRKTQLDNINNRLTKLLDSHKPSNKDEHTCENNSHRNEKYCNTHPHQRHWAARWSKQDYTTAFNSIQEYISAGDCYQVNLTMPFICQDDLTTAPPYDLLNTFNAPHSAYFKTPSRTIFSVSPERFLKIENGEIETRPIKGTAPRNADSKLDAKLAESLTSSTKNQAENLMIVDLLRNDLSRSATPGSVEVKELFKLESHHNVHHLVSTITAQLSTSPREAISNAFPGGSITGAPKKRAMEIINELEAQPRGAYCGSIGYLDDRGNADFNILIRTIEATTEGAICWGGGGITTASDADDEYNEIYNKIGKIIDFPL